MSLTSIMMNYVTKTEDSFICSATVESSDGTKATMLGQGKDIDTAMQTAISNSKMQLVTLSSASSSQPTYYPSQPSNNNHRNNNMMDNKSKFNGGGDKPASDKQISWIESSARKKGLSGDALAQEKFSKYMHQLSGAEAHKLIGELKFPKEF